MSIGLGQTASLEPVVEAALDVGVRAFAAADSVKLPVKPLGCSVSLSWPRALSSLHEYSWILIVYTSVVGASRLWTFDSQTTFETG